MIDSLEREIKDLRADLGYLKGHFEDIKSRSLVIESELEEVTKKLKEFMDFSDLRADKDHQIVKDVMGILQKLREKA